MTMYHQNIETTAGMITVKNLNVGLKCPPGYMPNGHNAVDYKDWLFVSTQVYYWSFVSTQVLFVSTQVLFVSTQVN